MVIWSEFRLGQYWDENHREDAYHVIQRNTLYMMKKHSIIIFVALMTTLRNALVRLGIQDTRKFCTACIAIGQMSAASQNRHMRMKIACLSLIINQCREQISNRFLYWKHLGNSHAKERTGLLFLNSWKPPECFGKIEMQRTLCDTSVSCR